MLEELSQAIAAADWPRALVLALDAWRELRAPALADLIDRLGARCPTEAAPRHRVQSWWIPRALTYDPIVATALCASASDLAHKSDVTWEVIASSHAASPVVQRLHAAVEPTFELAQKTPGRAVPAQMFRGTSFRNLVERLAVMWMWPDDPRVARVCATWFLEAKINWSFPHERGVYVLYTLLADLLVRLRDPRVLPVLEQVLAEPRAKTVGLREHQCELATRAIDSIAVAHPCADDAQIARWCPSPVVRPAVDERALWLDAAASPDARLVLADHLLERGDRRGEIITLACSGPDNARRGSSMLFEYWERWMGELALVLERGSCTFTEGLLDTATVGMTSTPEWAYAKTARHRELVTVRTVRPGWGASTAGYVAFLDALELLPHRVRVTLTMIETLARTRDHWPIQNLELVTDLPELRAPFADVIALASKILPDVEQLELPMPGELDASLLAIFPELPRVFPRLVRVRIDAARWWTEELRRALVEIAKLPFVEVDHGRNAVS